MKKTALIFTLILSAALAAAGCAAQGSPAVDKNTITLSDKGTTAPAGVTVTGSTVTVTAGGTYRVTGSLSDGQLAVNTPEQPVTLILDGVSIQNKSDAALTGENMKLLTIELAENSRNTLTSGKPVEITASAEADDDASGAALGVKGSLTLTGTGSLTVGGYLNNGISASKVLTIESGTLEVSAVHHGLRGKDEVRLQGGTAAVTAAGDGIHSDDTVAIKGGEFTVTSMDDGIHGDNVITMENGTVAILRSEEGVEANRVTINGGALTVAASDDGINASGDRSAALTINGGSVYVNADGDGLDSNGDIIINGGFVVVDGPSANNNAALDAGTESGGRLLVNGGTVLALGSSGMASGFDSASTQCSFLYGEGQFAPGTVITVTDSKGQELISYTAAKSGSCVIFSSAELAVGDTVTLNIGETTAEISLTEISTRMGGGFGNFGGKGGFGGGGQMRGERPDMERPGGEMPQMPPEGDRFDKGERPDREPPEGQDFDRGEHPPMEPGQEPGEGRQPPALPDEKQLFL